MIDSKTARAVRTATEELWKEKVLTHTFLELSQGSERGHRIADHVGDVTTSLLKTRFEARYQASHKGSRQSRSMGDIWLRSGGIYNPVNVKTGEYEKNGQPNLVSLKKLLRALLADQIDSYYLLIVKFKLDHTPKFWTFFVDLLDYLKFATFDSGPGQMMLKEREFYAAMEAGWRPGRQSLRDKITSLFAMLKDGERRLALNRKKDLEELGRRYKAYMARDTHKLDQSTLNLAHE